MLEIRADEQDVRRYVDGHISHLSSFVGRNTDLQEEIKTRIINTIEGMYVTLYGLPKIYTDSARFLLAQLHLDFLIGNASPKAVRAALAKLSFGSEAYDHAYKDVMERIEAQVTDKRDLAKQFLSWITYAKRQLTTSELRDALAVEIGESELDKENLPQIEDMVSVCAGLVTVDEESDTIRLVHYTTQEYFERTRTHWFPEAEIYITKTRVTYLSFSKFESGVCQTVADFKDRLLWNPFYNDAASNWGHHGRKALTLVHMTIDFLNNDAKVEASSQALFAMLTIFEISYSQIVPRQMGGIHLAAYFGLHEELRAFLSGQYTDLTDRYDRTPVSYAAENGHEAVVELLLEKDVDLESRDRREERTPLSYASGNGIEAIVKLLLEKDVDLESKDSEARTPLLWAANGHEAAVKLLLENGVDLESQDRYDRKALSYAAENGHQAVIRLLLEKGADLESKDNDSQTPLLYVARYGDEAVAELLLMSNNSCINSRGKLGRSSVYWAVLRKQKAVLNSLSSHGGVL